MPSAFDLVELPLWVYVTDTDGARRFAIRIRPTAYHYSLQIPLEFPYYSFSI